MQIKIEGNAITFDVAFRLAWADVPGYLVRRTKCDASEAEDIAQEVLLRFFERKLTIEFESEEHLRSYFKRSYIRTFIDRKRKEAKNARNIGLERKGNKQRGRTGKSMESFSNSTMCDDPHFEEVATAERNKLIESVLNVEQRRTLALYAEELDGMIIINAATNRKVAKRIKSTEQAINRRMRRIRCIVSLSYQLLNLLKDKIRRGQLTNDNELRKLAVGFIALGNQKSTHDLAGACRTIRKHIPAICALAASSSSGQNKTE